jgi:hypothetical protein
MNFPIIESSPMDKFASDEIKKKKEEPKISLKQSAKTKRI